MFEVVKEKNFVSVRVKLNKRVYAKDPKVYIYVNDALREAKKAHPDLNISDKADNNQVASTVRSPHEVTWKFKIIEQKDEQKTVKHKKFEKKQLTENRAIDLTSSENSATMEETLEKVQEPTE